MCVDHHEIGFTKSFDLGGHKKTHCQNSQSENRKDGAGDESDLEKERHNEARKVSTEPQLSPSRPGWALFWGDEGEWIFPAIPKYIYEAYIIFW